MIPADALDLVSWPALAGMLIVGAGYGAFLLWQSRVRRANVGTTTFMAVVYAFAASLFLTALRMFQPTEHWGRTIGTGIEFMTFGLGIGVGLAIRRRLAA